MAVRNNAVYRMTQLLHLANANSSSQQPAVIFKKRSRGPMAKAASGEENDAHQETRS